MWLAPSHLARGLERPKCRVHLRSFKHGKLPRARLPLRSWDAPMDVPISKGQLKGLEILSWLKNGSQASSERSSPRRKRRFEVRFLVHRRAGKRFCCNFILSMDSRHVPMVIGKGGENTKAIYMATGCKIRVRGRGSGHKALHHSLSDGLLRSRGRVRKRLRP